MTIIITPRAPASVTFAHDRMVDNILIALPALPKHIFLSFLVDEILLPRHMNWSDIFRGLLFYEEMALS